jgi:hypothetical protein
VRNTVLGATRAPHAGSSVASAAGAPRVRASGRWFIRRLVATSDRVGWLEYPSQSEANRPGDVARSRWVLMPAAGGAPRVVAADLLTHASSGPDMDEANVYLWLPSPSEALYALPLEGGPPRALGPVRYGANVGAAAGTVCFVSDALHVDGLFCTAREDGHPIEVAHVPGGTRAPVVLDGSAYWYVPGGRCLLRAPVDGAGESQRVSCASPLTGPIAGDGALLYAVGGYTTADGESTAVYAFRPSTGEWTLLHELPDGAKEIAAHGGRVAVLTSNSHGDSVTVLDSMGRACTLASGQPQALHLALATGRAFWTVERTTLGRMDVLEQTFATDDASGPCGARTAARP